MKYSKIDPVKLDKMLRLGISSKECAVHFEVSPAAISQAKKNLNIHVIKSVALENANKVVNRNLNTVDQLQKINEQANQLLDKLEKAPALKLKVMAEIRNQLRLQLEIFQTLYDMKAVQAFQNEVLQAIGEASPEIRERIIIGLNEKNALRKSLEFD